MATGFPTPDASQIKDLYQKDFGRDADAAGLDYWQKAAGNGASLSDIDAQFRNSDEYKALQNKAPSQPGLLNPATPVPAVTPATAVNATATTYDPTKQVVSDKSTVQNQIAGIVSSGSPLNTLAEAEANKQANRRGLLNSSIAVGAGQKAVLQSALPIAQQDASTNAAADAANAQYSNSASQFNAGAQNAASQTNAQLGTQVSLANSNQTLQQSLAQIQANTQMSLADKNNQTNLTIARNDNTTKQLLQSLDAASKVGLANIDADTKVKLANLDASTRTNLQKLTNDNQQLLQTNVSASNIFTQYMTNLANISTSDKMDGPAKQAAADNQLAALNAQLQAIGQISGLDLSKYFQASTPIVPPAATPQPGAINTNYPDLLGGGGG